MQKNFLRYEDTAAIQQTLYERYHEIATSFDVPEAELFWLKKDFKSCKKRLIQTPTI